MSKYLISDLIFQFFHSYMKKSSKSSLKKRSLDISLQHKNEATYKLSKKKNFCTWPKKGQELKGLIEDEQKVIVEVLLMIFTGV